MMCRIGRATTVLALWLVASPADAQQVSPPSAGDSVQFLAIGDTGTGDSAQYQVPRRLPRPTRSFRLPSRS